DRVQVGLARQTVGQVGRLAIDGEHAQRVGRQQQVCADVAVALDQQDAGRALGQLAPAALVDQRAAVLVRFVQVGGARAPAVVGRQRYRDALGGALHARMKARQGAQVG